jgi:hypothetical protein
MRLGECAINDVSDLLRKQSAGIVQKARDVV